MKVFADPWRGTALALVVLALVARLPSLIDRSLWFDEAFSWQLTRFEWTDQSRAGEGLQSLQWRLHLGGCRIPGLGRVGLGPAGEGLASRSGE